MTERSPAGTRAHDRTTDDLDPVQRSADLLTRRVAPAGVPPSTEGGAPAPATGLAIQMFADAIGAGMYAAQVQLDGGGGGLASAAVHRAAAHGMSGASSTLPHLGAIQRSFGRHDVSSVQAHVGGVAAEGAAAMGARAYASGGRVAFASSPDLHLAAHEAAHVVQQRSGVQLSGGVGAAGDIYERHADSVADAVVRGDSAEALLDLHAPSGGGSSGVQHAIQRDGEASAPMTVLRGALARVTDFVALQATQATVNGLMVSPLTADQICPVAIGGAEYPVRATDLPALRTAVDQRAQQLLAVDRGLAGRTDVGGPAVDVHDREHPEGTAREAPAHPEEHAGTSADAEGGFELCDFTFHVGEYANVRTRLLLETTIGGVAGERGESEGPSVGGGAHRTAHGAAFGVEERGQLVSALAPGFHAFTDSINVERDHEGVHFVAGVDFASFHLGALQESHFSMDLFEIENGPHGFRVHGPSVHFITALPLSAVAGLISPALASHMLGARLRIDVQVEPNWAGVLEYCGFNLAEEAAVHGAAGAAGTAVADGAMSTPADAALDAVGDALGDAIAEDVVGTELVTTIAGEEALALLAAAAPPVLIAAAIIGIGVLIYEASQGHDDPMPADIMSTDGLPGIDAPLMHVGHAFDRSINEFCAAYAAALRGDRAAGGSEAATNGFQAGAGHVRELTAAGHSRADISAMASQAPDLERRIRRVNTPGFVEQAHQLARGDARRDAFFVSVAQSGGVPIVYVPGYHAHRAS